MDALARQRLPATRNAVTRHFQMGRDDFYLTVGLDEKGEPREMFLRQASESGTHVAAALDQAALLFSLARQYHVPLGVIVDHFRGVRAGDVCGIPSADPYLSASSIWDAVARWFAAKWPEESAAVSIAPPKEGAP